MKNVPGVKWPTAPAHVGAFGPWAGRNDHGEGMPEKATLTPSADEPPVQEEEVATDVVLGEADDQGPE